MNILNIFDKIGYEFAEHGEQYRFSNKEVSKLFNTKNLGFHLEILHPQTFSCPYHYHEKEEELAIVIEGEAILRANGNFLKIVPGDLIYFSTGPESVHQIYNHTSKDFKFFALSTKIPDESCYYPDSNKILNRKDRILSQNGVRVDYWKDEEDPRQYWPANALNGIV
jgi:uncharacterized cupin superfamily protein